MSRLVRLADIARRPKFTRAQIHGKQETPRRNTTAPHLTNRTHQFDESLIYDEITKPVSELLIPMDQLEILEAKALFDAWADKPDKFDY